MIIRIKGAVAQCKMNNEKCKIKEGAVALAGKKIRWRQLLFYTKKKIF